jgi:leucyl-tRNA synthetase
LVRKLTTESQKSAVDQYVTNSSKKSDIDRQIAKEKTGVFTGAFALNPFNGTKIPIWIADYVMMGYGTGAIMAVPGHDSRDFEFAKKFDLPIHRVIESDSELPFEGDGKLVNSGFLNGLIGDAAITRAIKEVEDKKLGQKTVNYRLRDWLFSRQRYWGEPFPVVRFPSGDLKCVPTQELPILLPAVADYEPSDKGESPLARVKDWVSTKLDGQEVARETDTMPGSAGSSWYFLRYTDPTNEGEPFSFEAQNYWMPVDLYLGGAEHTVGHLLYARFWQKVLFDCGLVSHDEPFKKLIHQGMILGPDGEKMSKSRGNVINPDSVIEEHGADSLRMYEMFMGPLDKDKPWSEQGVEGVRRFLDRVYRLVIDEASGKVIVTDEQPTEDIQRSLHKTIKKVTEDIESLGFNTAISQMMIFVNEMYKTQSRPKSVLKVLTQLLMPFAPHLSEELWHRMGEQGLVSLAPWPKFNPDLCKDDTITMGVQVNGKMRGTVEIAVDESEANAVAMAMKLPTVQNAMQGMSLKKIIYKPGKILNLIAG